MMICTSAGPGGLKACMKSLSILSTGGFLIVERLSIMTPYFKTSASMEKQNSKKIEKAASVFFKKVMEPKIHKPTLVEIMKFRAVRSFAICRPNGLPKDYEYWKEKGWLDKEKYFYKAPQNIFKRGIGWLLEKISNWFYKKIMFKGVSDE